MPETHQRRRENDAAPVAPTSTPGASPATSAPTDAATARRARLAVRVAGGGLAVGILFDALLRTEALGVNFPLWIAGIVTAALLLLRERDGSVPREAAGAGAAAILFASCFAWRTSGMLGFLDLLAVLVSLGLLSLAALRAPLANLRFGTVGEYVVAGARSIVDVLTGAIPLAARDVDLREVSTRLRRRRLERVALGLALALPLLLVFGGLFAQADAVFGKLVDSLVVFELGTVLSHLFLVGIFTWLAGGYLRGVVLARREPELGTDARGLGLGITEIGIALAALDALFLLFVLVQLRYLFGGDALVQATAGMTYAEYARRGFFELCWAAVLVLPVLLVAQRVLRVESDRDRRVFRGLAVTLVALVGVVMVSALARLRLYTGVYGWTEDRIFAIAVIGWLATVFAWYLATVVRGRARGFAFGAVVSGALVLGSLNLFDPDAWVVTKNREMALAGTRELDPNYGWWRLSADAVPSYLPSLALLPEKARCEAARGLLEQWGGEATDWREWNLSRARARRAVHAHRAELQAMLTCPAPAAKVTAVSPTASKE